MRITIVGCSHGELDVIYDLIKKSEADTGKIVDLLLICGDFQAIRNDADLMNINVPHKYKKLGDFHAYYSGQKTAPCLTIFIGGNHESSAFLWELYYGGWVAPNIFFLGWANVIQIGDLKLGGISGIYKPQSYHQEHFEIAPYSPSDIRSIYHLRKKEIQLFSMYDSPINIFLSHDWPKHIAYYGETQKLISTKPFFKDDIASGNLGAPPLLHLLHHLKPDFWFSAHLHVKFPALVSHSSSATSSEYDLNHFSHLPDLPSLARSSDSFSSLKITKFLALDKCLPKRDFIQFLDTPYHIGPIKYDDTWLALLRSFHFNSNLKDEKHWVQSNVPDLTMPLNFSITAPTHPITNPHWMQLAQTGQLNPQTVQFCKLLEIPCTINPNGITVNDYSSQRL